jgi:hypothetical protein
MDELQLRMPVKDVTKVADAVESHLMAGDAGPNTEDLERILTWLRYRIARAQRITPPAPRT